MGDPRSVSQLKEYEACPHRYYLHRIAVDENGDRTWERPAAWLPQGLGVHEAAEAWEKSGRTMSLEDMEDVYRESYATHTNRLAKDTPNFNYWFRSGPYAGERDIERRYGLGLEQCGKYIDYYTEKAPKEVIWIAPDGTPAIELSFDIDLDGVRVRGYLDQAIDHPDHGVIVRDVKTGNLPGDELQLATYAVALQEQYDVEVLVGDYWMGRKGKPTVPYQLDEWGKERITEEFKKLDEAVKEQRFDPDPEPSKCMFCAVNASCDFALG